MSLDFSYALLREAEHGSGFKEQRSSVNIGSERPRDGKTLLKFSHKLESFAFVSSSLNCGFRYFQETGAHSSFGEIDLDKQTTQREVLE